MDRSDLGLIMHIRAYCEDADELVQRFGKDYQVFIEDIAFYYSLTTCIMQVGQLANELSDEFREKTKDQIPWLAIRGMRNTIAHDYHTSDDKILWDTVINDLPELHRFCEMMLGNTREKEQQPLANEENIHAQAQERKSIRGRLQEIQRGKAKDTHGKLDELSKKQDDPIR